MDKVCPEILLTKDGSDGSDDEGVLDVDQLTLQAAIELNDPFLIYSSVNQQSYWKSPFMDDLHTKTVDVSIVMLVYQRVDIWLNN